MSWKILWEGRRTPEDLLQTALNHAGMPGWPTKDRIIRAAASCLRSTTDRIPVSDVQARKHLKQSSQIAIEYAGRVRRDRGRSRALRNQAFRVRDSLKADAIRLKEGSVDGEIANAGLQLVLCITHTPNHTIETVRRIARGFVANACRVAQIPVVLPKRGEATWYGTPEEGKKAYRKVQHDLLALLRSELIPDFDLIEGDCHE